MRPLIVIPARLASQRLPLKPLADIEGKPMIVHVYERGLEADAGPVVVACDDVRIAEAVQDAGGHAVMTDPELPSGTDRVHAAARAFDPAGQYDVIVNLQGDMPFADPLIVQKALKVLEDPHFDVATAANAIVDQNDPRRTNPNVAKIAMTGMDGDSVRQALYFSRCPIPFEATVLYHHIGLYAYRPAALDAFVNHTPTALELTERLEQLRALALGLRIGVSFVNAVPSEVNTPEDLAEARAYAAKRVA